MHYTLLYTPTLFMVQTMTHDSNQSHRSENHGGFKRELTRRIIAFSMRFDLMTNLGVSKIICFDLEDSSLWTVDRADT